MSRLLNILKVAIPAAVFTPLASAHPGHDGHDLTWDFSGGFVHPLSGWDHLLAMVAVGLWASQLGARARWLVPAAFVATMAAAAALGRSGLAIPGIEQGIAASVLVLGLLVAATVRIPATAGMALVGVFAIFHGIAHASEMPADASGLSYSAGFIAATALLHAAGLSLGLVAARTSVGATRLAGWAIATCGVAMLVT